MTDLFFFLTDDGRRDTIILDKFKNLKIVGDTEIWILAERKFAWAKSW